MTHIERLYLLDRLHHLIHKKGTGTPKELAKRLDVSERTVYNLITILKNLGAEIIYCTGRRSYYYSIDVIFNFLPVVQKDNIRGGTQKTMYLQYNFNTFFDPLKEQCSKTSHL